MDVFGTLTAHDFGEVHFKRDKATQLRAIVAIHDSRLGPALGGCRFIEYDTDEAALVDALRLARGMTYKAALAGLAHGGGKSVIIRPEAALRSRRAVPRVRHASSTICAATTSPPRTAAPGSRTWRSSAR